GLHAVPRCHHLRQPPTPSSLLTAPSLHPPSLSFHLPHPLAFPSPINRALHTFPPNPITTANYKPSFTHDHPRPLFLTQQPVTVINPLKSLIHNPLPLPRPSQHPINLFIPHRTQHSNPSQHLLSRQSLPINPSSRSCNLPRPRHTPSTRDLRHLARRQPSQRPKHRTIQTTPQHRNQHLRPERSKKRSQLGGRCIPRHRNTGRVFGACQNSAF